MPPPSNTISAVFSQKKGEILSNYKMFSYLYGHILLFRFGLGQLPLLLHLPGWLTDPAKLERRLATLRDGTIPFLTLTVPSDQADTYNLAFKELGASLRALHPKQMLTPKRSLLLNLVRAVTVTAAWYGSTSLTLVVAISQFLIAPYSLFVSITAGIGFIQYLLLPHYLAYATLHFSASLLPQSTLLSCLTDWGQLPITPLNIGLFLLLDQLLCLQAILTPGTVTYSTSKILRHALHGFVNSKTMVLVILLLCYHHHPTISLWVWIVEGFFIKATPRISVFLSSCSLHFNAVFYHQHRMAHLPVVYQHAHKLHHAPGNMAGVTAFDASLYGCGMPEEFLVLATELVLLSVGFPPASLSWYVLHTQGLGNKHGHTIKEEGEGRRQESFHTDHHLTHTKNYGFAGFHCLLDLFFSTATRKDGHFILANKRSGSTSSGKEVMVEAVVEPGSKVISFLFTAVDLSVKEKPFQPQENPSVELKSSRLAEIPCSNLSLLVRPYESKKGRL